MSQCPDAPDTGIPPLRLTVNGRPVTVRARDLDGLLLQLELGAVVAELNGRIVPREDFARTVLQDGDKIELVRFVGGG